MSQPSVAIAAIKEAVSGRETEVLDKLRIGWRDGHPHIRCPYLTHVDKHASWRWDVTKRVAFCTCASPQTIFEVLMRVEGCDFSSAVVRVAELLGREDLIGSDRKTECPTHTGEAPGCTVAEYATRKDLPEDFLRPLGISDTTYARRPAIKIAYRASGGTEIAARCRIAMDGPDRFRWSKGSKAILYGLDRLSDAHAARFVALVEGESDCHTLWLHGFPALGLPGATTWNEDRDAPMLDGLTTVYIVIEPDKGGAAILKWLRRSSIAARARLVRLQGAKDPSALHLRDRDGFRTAFQRALDEAEPYTPPADPKARDAAPKAGHPLVLTEPERWPHSVDGAELLDDVVAALRRYVVLGAAEADAVAAWCIASHAFLSFQIFPRLLVTSPEKRCGKSTLLDAIERLIPRALATANITAAAFSRIIEAYRPCLILDEADTFARDNEDLRGVLNAGHKANGMVVRTVESGKAFDVRAFSVFAPVVLAAIGHLPGTIEDRSLIIKLQRRRHDEVVESLRSDRPNELNELARKAARWTADRAEEIRNADPMMPPGLINRAADNWRPLLTVADLAGGHWPERARRAAVRLNGENEDDSRRIRLLEDIRTAFQTKNVDRIASIDLVAFLTELEGHPWAEISNGRSITKNGLARLLKVFAISPGTVWTAARSAKGYKREQFEDAFSRYLPAAPNGTVRPSGTAETRFFALDFETSGASGSDVLNSGQKPQKHGAPDDLTVQKGGAEQKDAPDAAPWETTI